MTDLKTFANQVVASANHAEYLRAAIEWMEPDIGSIILTEPKVDVSQTWAAGTPGYWQAMELISAEMNTIVEDVAKATLDKAKKELAEIEAMFARFAEQETTP